MNLKNKSRSLMFKTMSILIFFSILILILLYVFQNVFANFYYENYKVKQVNNISYNIDSNSDNLAAYLEKVSSEYDVCIQFVGTDVSIIYNENAKGCLLTNPSKNVQKIMNGMFNSTNQTTFYKVTNPIYNTKSFLFGKRVEGIGYIFINSQLETLDKATIILNNQLIYLLFIFIFLSTVLAYFVSNVITKPILEITSKAKKMGNGNLNVVFERSNISEIDELSETLNYARNEMVKTDDYRRDLMANVGHDLKTPLTLIKSYAEMVRDISYKDSDKREEHLNVIISETDRLNNLVNDILSLSKLESSREELKITEYDLVEQINEIIGKFKILEITENYNFIYKGPKKALVKADRDKISQVIYNLINNAINYTGDDMIIYINVNKNKNKSGYQVEIIDTGKGIDDETVKHIWDRYYKTEKKHRRNKVGTGLGLAIVKEILEAHNFKYGVKSSIGKGTNFYFYIK